MKRNILLLTLALAFTATISADISKIKPIRQSTKIKHLCGVTCAEMVFKYYGEKKTQYDIGKRITKMIIPYKKEHPEAKGALEFKWPNYKETYQPILAKYYRDNGFEAINTKTYYDKKTGIVNESRVEEFLGYLKTDIPVMIHVESHYMLAIGYNEKMKKVYLNDPANGKKISVNLSQFINRNNPWYKKRKGWDGRLLAAWKE